MSEAGPGRLAALRQSSPSFLVALAVVVALPLGYLAWTILRPNPVAQSEQVVRDASAAIAKELAPFRRAVRELSREAGGDPTTAARARGRIDQLAAEVVDEVENLADEATFAVESIEGISLNTQENRLRRIRRLSLEARSRVAQLVAEAHTAFENAPAQVPADPAVQEEPHE